MRIGGSSATRNEVIHNSIYGNGGLGIDLGDDGVTANDPDDADIGPNNLQNSPVIDLEIVYSNDAATMSYSVDSDPANSSYPLTVQFFIADDGEGKSLFETDTFTEDDFTNGGKELTRIIHRPPILGLIMGC